MELLCSCTVRTVQYTVNHVSRDLNCIYSTVPAAEIIPGHALSSSLRTPTNDDDRTVSQGLVLGKLSFTPTATPNATGLGR